MAHRPLHSTETNNVDVASLPSGKPTYFQQVTYKASADMLWQALSGFQSQGPSLGVVERQPELKQIWLHSVHAGWLKASVQSTRHAKKSLVVFEEFQEGASPSMSGEPILTSGIRFVLEQQFALTNDPTLRRWGCVKAAGGAGIVCAGTALSLATGMQVVFYGAVIMGSFWCLAGIVQAVIGEKTV